MELFVFFFFLFLFFLVPGGSCFLGIPLFPLSGNDKRLFESVIPLVSGSSSNSHSLSTNADHRSANDTREEVGNTTFSSSSSFLYPNCSGGHCSTHSSTETHRMGTFLSTAGGIPLTTSSATEFFTGGDVRKQDTDAVKPNNTFAQTKEGERRRRVEEEPPSTSSSPPPGKPGSRMGSKDTYEDPEELVLQTWAFCKAKPSPPFVYTSERELEKRREALQFRERPSFKNLDCGEDSFFVANHHRAMGVADGVGGWRKKGVDPSEFSNALMAHAKSYADTHEKELDPQKIMDAAHQKIIEEKKVKAGSSTACIATLKKTKDGSHELDVANLGDSGLLVVRDRKYVFRARERQHRFNAPYQLSVSLSSPPGRSLSDTAKDAARERVRVQEGDVIVMGTDGLFDNRFAEHLAEDAGWIGWLPSNYTWSARSGGTGGEHSTAERPTQNGNAFLSSIPIVGRWLAISGIGNEPLGFTDPYRVAQRLVMDASRIATDRNSVTPWSMALRKQGRDHSTGGKEDDITVILGRIGKRGANNSNVPTW